MCDEFIESGYKFDFSSSLKSYKAEKICEKTYPLVDFVVETEDNFLLIEVKNPDHQKSNDKNRETFLNRTNKVQFHEKMSENYKNTLLRMSLENDFFRKTVVCIFILECKQFSSFERIVLYGNINNKIPYFLNQLSKKQVIAKFKILSIEEFRNEYPCFSVIPIN